ncbi:hypothetical protein DID78_03570 [Candidatus Marinamargulisbacteria bacterium SCGC AG-343-D04]|nr:hypothetical protein DID78_03570 [Candidatus Marinamargulisbacteria bacterium SCGC AG-343-D04]
MKVRQLKCLFVIAFFMCSTLYSHPVIWKKGKSITSTFSSNISDLRIHYSLSQKWSLGAHLVQLDQDAQGIMIQNNVVFKRWNSKHSQANIYFFSGLGGEISKGSLCHLGTQIDFETRKIYTQLNMDAYIKEKNVYFMSARAGFSPYLVGYNGISSWIILQLDSMFDERESSHTILPVLRFFKDNKLLEIGSDFENKSFMKIMIHY